MFDLILSVCQVGEISDLRAIIRLHSDIFSTFTLDQKIALIRIALGRSTKDLFVELQRTVDSVNFLEQEELDSAFLTSCKEGQTDMALFLLTLGANIHAKDKDGKDGLHHAVIYGKFTVIALLDQLKQDQDFADIILRVFVLILECEGFSLLGKSLLKTMLLVYPEIDISQKTPEGDTLFLLAAKHGWSEIVAQWCDRLQDLDDQCDSQGNTAMHLAAKRGDMAVMRVLTQAFALNPYQENQAGDTAAHVAASVGQFDFLKAFIMLYNFDVNQQNTKDGSTLLHHLLRSPGHWYEKTITLQWLIKKHANANLVDKIEGLSSFMLACRANLYVAQWLVKHHHVDNINLQSSQGISALMWGCFKEKTTLVEWLCTLPGIDIESTRIISGDTALNIAFSRGNLTIVKLLVAKGAKVNFVNPANGSTPFIHACCCGQLAVAQWLVTHHHVDDINLKVLTGKSALMLASQKKQEHVVQWLLTLPGIDTQCLTQNQQTNALGNENNMSRLSGHSMLTRSKRPSGDAGMDAVSEQELKRPAL